MTAKPSQKQITISRFKLSQAPQIAAVFHNSVSDLVGKGYSEAQCHAWSGGVRDRRFWRARLERSLVYVAEMGGMIVGFIDCELRFDTRGYIGHLYVAPEYQRLGIASALAKHLIREAPALGVAHLSTDASRLSRGLFQRLGFEFIERNFQKKAGEIFEGFRLALSLPFYVDKFRQEDLGDIAILFHESVQGAGEFYSEAQRAAWSPALRSKEVWAERLAPTRVWVARASQGLAGFINLLPKGQQEAEIDCLFTHPALGRNGVATTLYRLLEQKAEQLGVRRLTVEASFYARPFFLKQGFVELGRNEHPRHGEILVNFSMVKLIGPDRLARLTSND